MQTLQRLGVALALLIFALLAGRALLAQSDSLSFVRGTIVEDTATLTFSEELNPSSTPPTSAFQVFTGGSSRMRRVNAVEVAGSSILLTLGVFVSQGDEATIEYCSSGTGCGDPIQSRDGSRTFTAYGMLTPITTPGPPPEVSGILVDAYTITLDFDLELDANVVPDGSAFDITGFSTTVRKITINGRQVVLHVLPPMPPWRHSYDPGLAYTPPAANGLETKTKPSARVAAFSRSSLNNNNSKLVVAELAVEGADVQLTFRVELDESRQPPADNFTVCPAEDSDDSDCTAAADVSIDGQVVTLSFPVAALPGSETVWLRYSGTRLRGRSGSRPLVGMIAAHPFQVPAAAAPILLSGVANGSTVTLTFDSTLDSVAAPPASAFLVNDEQAVGLTISGAEVTLTPAQPVTEGAAVAVQYRPGETTKLQGANGAAVAGFTTTASNITDTAPQPLSAAVTGRQVSITFDQELDAGSEPLPSSFSVSADGQTIAIDSVALSAELAELTLADAVGADAAVTVSYTRPDTDKLLVDATGNAVESFGPLSADNLAAPAASAAVVDGSTLTISFDADLDTTSAPAAAAFQINGRSAAEAAVQKRTVVLTITPPASEGVSLSVSYSPVLAGAEPLRGANGTVVPAFSALQIENQTDTAPAVVDGAVDGSTITLTFDQVLDSSAVPPVLDQGLSSLSAFRVTVAELRVGFQTIEVDGRSIIITLLTAVAPTAVVQVQYQLQTNSPLQDTSQPPNLAPSFDPLTLRNETATQAMSAEVVGWTLEIAFNSPLQASSPPGVSAFSVTSGEATLTLSSVSVKGSTLSLRLAQAVRQTAAVQIAYTVPEENALQDANGRPLAAFSLAAANATPDAATLSSAAADGSTVTLLFNRPLFAAPGIATSAFGINGQEPASAAISHANVLLTAVPAIEEGDEVSVVYTPPATGPLLDEYGLAIAAFSASAANNTDTAPTVVSAAAAEQSVQVVFDQDLDTASTPPASAFSLGAAAPSITGVAMAENIVTLTITCCVLPGPALQLTYSPDSSKPLRDPTGNAAPSFTTGVLNRAQQGPSLQSAAVNGAELRITFDAALAADSVPASDVFTIAVGDATAAVNSVAVANGVLVLQLASSIPGDQAVTISYRLPTAKPLSTPAGAVVAPISEQAVENNSPPLLSAASVKGAALTLEFDTALNEAVTPEPLDFTVTNAAVATVLVSGRTVQLTLDTAAVEAAVVQISYEPSEDEERGIAGSNSVRFGAVSGRMVDNQTDTAPVVTAATVNLKQLQVTFDQPLDAAQVPAGTAFTIGPDAIAIESIQIASSALVLTLAQAVLEGAAVTLAYTPPSEEPLQDATGNMAAAFSADVDNQTDTPPMLAQAVVDGAALTLTFDEQLDAAAVPDTAHFAVTGRSIESVAVEGQTVTLALMPAAADGVLISVQYSAPDSGGLRDTSGNAVTSFTQELVNQTDSAPSAVSAGIAADGASLQLSFSEALSEEPADMPPPAQFTLGGTDALVSSVVVSGQTITLSLAPSAQEGEAVTLAYTAGAANALRDADQGRLPVAAFSINADNPVDYAALPIRAVVDGEVLTITFDQPLDSASPLTGNMFTVSIANKVVTVTAAAVDSELVALNLQRAATAADDAAVSYTAPKSGGLRDLSDLPTASFGPIDAENRTPPSLLSASADLSTIVLTFDAALEPQAAPPVTAFTVNFATVSGAAVNEREVTLSLAAPVREGAPLMLFYDPPTAELPRLQGVNGAPVEAIPGFMIENVTDTIPVVAAVEVNLNHAAITFDQDLDTAANPDPASFALQGSAAAVTAAAVRNDPVSGLGVVALSFSANVQEGAAITIEYDPGESDSALRDPEGNAVEAFAAAAENRTDTAPSAVSGSVDADAAAVAFDQPLDTEHVPPAADFTVSGTAAAVQSVQVRNDAASGAGVLALTLDPAVAEGELVTLNYSAPTAEEIAVQPGLQYLRDQQGNPASITDLALANLTDTPPRAVSAAVDSQSLTIVFDQQLDPTSVPAAASFSLDDGPAAQTVTLDGSQVHIALSASIADGAAVRLSYSIGPGNRIRDLTGNDAAAFAIDVQNTTDTAPTAQSAEIDVTGASLTLQMSEAVQIGPSAMAAPGGFTLDGSEAQIESITTAGATVSLNLGGPTAHELDQVVLHYAPPEAAGRLLDADQGELPVAGFEITVANHTDTAPVMKSAAVEEDVITLLFDQPLAAGPGPPYLNDFGEPLNAFRVWVNGAARPFRDSEVEERAVRIELLQSVAVSDLVQLQYQMQTISPLRDTSVPANLAASFDPIEVSNATPAAPVSAQVDGVSLEIEFDALLSDAPLTADAFAVWTGAERLHTVSAEAAGAAVALELAAAAVEGAAVRAAYEPPEEAALLDAAGRPVRAFEIDVQNTTDTAPQITAAAADRSTITLRFDQELSGAADFEHFTVSDRQGRAAVIGAQISGAELVLTLVRSLLEGSAVRVEYAPKDAGGLADPTGNVVEAFAVAAENTTARPPQAVSAESWLTELVITFDEPLDPSRLPAAADFTLSRAPAVLEVLGISGTELRLRLHEPGAGPDSRIRLTYSPNSSRPILDRHGNSTAAFTIALTDRGRAPIMERAVAVGRVVLIHFDRPLDPDHVPPRSWWIAAAESSAAVEAVFVSRAGSVTLLLEEPGLPESSDVIVAYLARHRETGALRGAAGHRVDAASVLAPNYTQLGPVAVAASAAETILEVQFSEAVAAGGAEPEWFTVTAGRRTIRVIGVEWRETRATLTLQTPVTARDAVTLSYEPRLPNGVHDATGRRLAGFTLPAANEMLVAPTPEGRIAAAHIRARGDTTQPMAIALRRELVHEFAWRGGVYATVQTGRGDAHEGFAAQHDDGLPAFTLHAAAPPAGAAAVQIEVRPLTRRVLLDEIFDDIAALTWDPDGEQASILSAWRIALTDERGTPLDGSADLSVRLPLAPQSAPLAFIVFDLASATWRQVEVEQIDGGIALRVRAPSMIAIAEMPTYGLTLRRGVTPIVFQGESGLPARELALSIDPSVMGIGVPTASVKRWRYVAARDSWGGPYELQHAERVLIVRGMGAPPLKVELPMALGEMTLDETG